MVGTNLCSALARFLSRDQPVPNSNEMVVYITGAVMNPGVYTLPENSRLINAVTSAGGLKAEADAEIINQAAPLQDGARIYIPRIGEENITLNRSSEIIISGDCPTSVSNDGMQIEIININTAGQEELEKLPGIGPEKAQAIIQYRTEISRFNKIEEVRRLFRR